jgi:hypothetical protein
MIAIKGLAAAAVLGTAALAFAPHTAADPARETFAVSFRYDAAKGPLENYLAFARQAERACAVPGLRPLDQRMQSRVCAEDLINRMVAAMGRADLAEIHALRTGRPDDSSRMLAAR